MASAMCVIRTIFGVDRQQKLWNRSGISSLAAILLHIFCQGHPATPDMNPLVILSILLAICAIGYVLLGGRLLRGDRTVGSVPLGLTFVTVGLWVVSGSVEMMATSFTMFSIGRTGHFLGTALVPVGMLLCFREYTGSNTSKTMTVALLIVPVVSVIIAATNYWHEFMWFLPAVGADSAYLTRPQQWGPWFLFVHAPYGYSVVGIGILTLVMHSSAVAPAHRRGLFLLAGSAIVPIFAVIAYDFGIGPDTVSTLPIAFAAMLPAYAWLIIGEQVTEFSPLAYATVFQNMQDPVVVVDDQKRIIGLNRGAEKLLNISEGEALKASLDSVFGDDVPEVYEALSTGCPQKMMTHSGRFLHLQVTPISPNQALSRTGRVLMFRDVSDVEKAQAEVQSSEQLLRTLIDHSVNGIIRMRWVADDAGDKSLKCIFANAAAGRFLRTDREDMIGYSAQQLVKLVASGMDNSEGEILLRQFVEAAESGEVLDTEAKVAMDGGSRWLQIIAESVRENVAVTLVDITDRKAKEQQMESMASSDPLTGVLNRRGFERDAARRLTDSDDLATGALLFIDLNDFKQINDQCGHEIGDQLLIVAAERIRTSLRSCDIIGRPGGDEFVALVPDVTVDVAEKLAKRLTNALEDRYVIGKETLVCAAAIGLAMYPAHANTLTGLLRAADQAMYRAKARCRGANDVSHHDLLEKAI